MAAYAVPQSYQSNDILTAPPGRLVVLLYDGATKFLRQGAVAMRHSNIERSNKSIQRAEAIISELNVTLDMSAGEIAERLRAIYLFSRRHLAEARLERNPEKIDAVSRMLGELRQSWAQIAGE